MGCHEEFGELERSFMESMGGLEKFRKVYVGHRKTSEGFSDGFLWASRCFMRLSVGFREVTGSFKGF